MDALEKRIADRMAAEVKQLQAEQMRIGRERQKLVKQTDRAQEQASAYVVALKDGAVPSKQVADKGVVGLKAMGRLARQILALNERARTNGERIALLDEPAERDRRVQHAKELGVSDQPMTGLDAAEVVLIRRGRAMHVTDLTREVLESGVVKLSGATPTQTMSAYLSKEVAKPDSRFVRLAPGVFDVKTREPAAQS